MSFGIVSLSHQGAPCVSALSNNLQKLIHQSDRLIQQKFNIAEFSEIARALF